jgi:hypothetical protein
MSTMSGQMRLLLDKNIVRRYFEGVSALARGLTLVEEEQQAILLVHLARRKERRLFISVEVFNLLQAHGRQVSPAETLMFLKRDYIQGVTSGAGQDGYARRALPVRMPRCWPWGRLAQMPKVPCWVSRWS